MILVHFRRRMWKRWEATRAYQLGPRQYCLRDDALLFESPTGTFALKLAALHRIVRYPRVLLFYFDEQNAHFMPRAAFVSPEQETEFLAVLRDRAPATSVG